MRQNHYFNIHRYNIYTILKYFKLIKFTYIFMNNIEHHKNYCSNNKYQLLIIRL